MNEIKFAQLPERGIKEQKKHFENITERQTETLTRQFQASLQEIQTSLGEEE